MAQLVHFLNEILDFFRAGFNHVNALLGLIIAIVCTVQLAHWKKLWEIAIAATLVHVIAEVLLPVIDHNAPLRLPPLLDVEFWQYVLALYLGYVVVIAVFFFVKTRLMKGGGGHH